MKYIEKIREHFKVDDEVKNCPLNPFIMNYYDEMEPEYYDEAIKNTKNTIFNNKIYIRFLKEKISQNKTCKDFYNLTHYDNLLKDEILEKEYINNTAKYIIEYLKYKKRKYKESQKQVKDGVNNG